MKAMGYQSGLLQSSVSHWRYMCIYLTLSALFSIFLIVSPAMAEPQVDSRQKVTNMHLYVEQNTLYCDFSPILKYKHLADILNEGTALNFTWKFSVERQRSYWIDEGIQDLTFIRQVKPDLVSKVWLLNDSHSKNSHQTTNTDKALHFLSNIHHIAVMDTDQFQSGETYIVTAKLNISEGELSDSWWSEAFRFGKTVAIGSFTQP